MVGMWQKDSPASVTIRRPIGYAKMIDFTVLKDSPVQNATIKNTIRYVRTHSFIFPMLFI